MVVIATLGVVAFLAFAISSRAATASGRVPDVDAPLAQPPVTGLQSSSASATMVALHRVWRAARAACGERPAPMELDENAQYRRCMAEEVKGGLAALGDPRVMAADSADCKLEASVASR
jgi:UrcA family protein